MFILFKIIDQKYKLLSTQSYLETNQQFYGNLAILTFVVITRDCTSQLLYAYICNYWCMQTLSVIQKEHVIRWCTNSIWQCKKN